MTKKEYNGWYNYETWLINLWLDNNEGSQSYWQDRAREALEQNDNDKDDASQSLASEIESAHEQEIEESGIGESCWMADMLSGAMSEVNWREIAEHIVDAVVEEETADNAEP